MPRLLELLERKNLCYRSFHKLCHDFLEEIAADKIENLERFQKRRQGIINVLEQLDFETSHWVESAGEPDAEAKEKLNALFNEKDAIIKSILDLDSQILTHIDRVKHETIQKLHSISVGRRGIGAYRSPIDSVETAEFNKVLDRKA